MREVKTGGQFRKDLKRYRNDNTKLHYGKGVPCFGNSYRHTGFRCGRESRFVVEIKNIKDKDTVSSQV